jgi:hypothetical protein
MHPRQHRTGAEAADFWSTAKTVDQILSQKLCLASRGGGCSGPIIRAHTIPKSQLDQIDVAGHVYHMRGKMGDLEKNQGQITAGKAGIGEFSVLHCFCSAHDKSLFAPIEDDKLVFDSRQIALLHYRAMGAELYKKMTGLPIAKLIVKKLKGSKHGNRVDRVKFAESHLAGTIFGVRDIAATFGRCDEAISMSDYACVSALVLRFKKIPSIMTVGGFAPQFDYNGRRLQTLGEARITIDHVSVSILAANGNAAVVFAWLRNASVGKAFTDSFIIQQSHFFTTLAIQTAFEHIENTCMNITWWDSMRDVERNALLRRMQSAASLFEERLSGCLTYCGITFDQWDYENHEFINC